MVMTSLKWRHNYILKFDFCHNQLQKPLFGQITELQVTNFEGYGALGTESTQRLAIFENLLLN